MDPSQALAPILSHASGELAKLMTPLSVAKILLKLRGKWKAGARLKALQAQIDKLASRVRSIDPAVMESEAFHSLALRIVLAAEQDHREEKHAMLAAAWVSAAGSCASWPYEKQSLLLDLAADLEPYHVTILERCPARWGNLIGIVGIPEPEEDVLTNAISRLESYALLDSVSGGEPQFGSLGPRVLTPNRGLSNTKYTPKVHSPSWHYPRARFARTRLADDFLIFLQRNDGPGAAGPGSVAADDVAVCGGVEGLGDAHERSK